MTREEKANSLGQEYFPSANNVWARPNFEAQWVSEACMKMAEWERKRLIEKACDWLGKNYTNYMIQDLSKYVENVCSFDIFSDLLIDDFREAMEE